MGDEKFLVVDDKEINIHFLLQILKKLGYNHFETCLNGEDAIIKVDSFKPDLIFMDINLEGEIDGIETIQQIQKKYDIPVIYLTAHTEKETIDRAKSTNPVGYVIKPVNELQINAALEMAFYRYDLEKKLKESEERYRAVVQQSSDGIYLVDVEKKQVIDSNRAIQEMLGYTENELKNLPVYDFIVTDKKSDTIQAPTYLKSPISIEQTYKRKDGHYVDVLASTTLIYLGGKEFYCTIARNITEIKKMIIELERAQRLESLGTLAGGLAHNFNNLYQGVIGNLSLAKMSITSDSDSLKYINRALEVLPKVRNLTQQLITFSKGGFMTLTVNSINDLLVNTSELVLLNSNTRHEFNIADNLWFVRFDDSLLSQVIHNIVLNALQSLEKKEPDNREIIISASNYVLGPDYLEAPLESGRYVKISIKDTGIGISKENLNRIFDPFFTTYIPERIGLGLTVAYSIIRKHNGYIKAISEINKGTEIIILLPAV